MRFETSAVVATTPATAFALTQDYAKRLTWDPFLRSAELLGGAGAPQVGVRAWCVSRAGLGMETEYVSFSPPKVAAVRMTRGPWVLAEFAGTWEFRGPAEGPTTITFRYHLRTRPGWLSWLMEPVAARWFARETKGRVAALSQKLQDSDPEGGPGSLTVSALD